MIRIVLVDDQELVRAGLRGILLPALGFEIVGECGDGGEAVRTVTETRPDVVLMDVRMPFVGGVEATALMQPLDVPVLALTTFDDDEALAGMLRAGAAGFVLKGVTADDLHRAVRAVADGGAWLDPAVTRRVLDDYRRAPSSTGDGRAATLTDREREVLGLIARGLTNSEIGDSLFVGEGTVKTHVNRIFAKLEVRDRAAAVVFVYENGGPAAFS